MRRHHSGVSRSSPRPRCSSPRGGRTHQAPAAWHRRVGRGPYQHPFMLAKPHRPARCIMDARARDVRRRPRRAGVTRQQTASPGVNGARWTGARVIVGWSSAIRSPKTDWFQSLQRQFAAFAYNQPMIDWRSPAPARRSPDGRRRRHGIGSWRSARERRPSIAHHTATWISTRPNPQCRHTVPDRAKGPSSPDAIGRTASRTKRRASGDEFADYFRESATFPIQSP